jgi:hypothetical protein
MVGSNLAPREMAWIEPRGFLRTSSHEAIMGFASEVVPGFVGPAAGGGTGELDSTVDSVD